MHTYSTQITQQQASSIKLHITSLSKFQFCTTINQENVIAKKGNCKLQINTWT